MKNLPPDTRPREKLLARGPGALADAELLALLLRTGIAGKGVLQMSQELLDSFGGVASLLHASADDLKRIKGLGPAKRAELVAVLELARRALSEQLKARQVFESPDALKQYLQLHLSTRSYEVFAVLFLDAATRLLANLTEKGLVSRAADPADGRCSIVSATPEGRAMLKRIRSRKNAYLAQRMRDLSDEDVVALERAAEILERVLEEERR